MSHELAFADAARPTPVVVLNLLLAEYSLGHELLLFRRRNALLLASPAEFSALELWQQLHAIREAVWVCSDPASVRMRFEQPSAFMLRHRLNEFNRRRWVRSLRRMLPDDYALAAAEFRNYLAAAHSFPTCPSQHATDVLYSEEKDAAGRVFGQPFTLTLYQFVYQLPVSERPACAWDFSFANATWQYFAHCEAQGNFRIENQKEAQIQAEKDRFESEIAAEKLAEAAQAKAEAAAPVSAGLATAVPSELFTEGAGHGAQGAGKADFTPNASRPTPDLTPGGVK